MNDLNENGRIVCMMAATMAGGIMANPVYNNRPIKPDEMVHMAAEMVRLVLAHPECKKLVNKT